MNTSTREHKEKNNWKQEGAFVVILGAGESGIGAALLAKQKGYNVFVSDKSQIKATYKEELINNKIPLEEGEHTIEKLKKANVIVKSPGIPDHISLIKELKNEGIPVISEIEFAAKHTIPTAKIIGISGSNGKTTTTKLTYHLLKTAGLNVDVGGNIGKSFARLLAENAQQGKNQRDYYVLELSSFQLDGIVEFRPYISILLNITPDHLDRYEYKMENYVASKFKLIQNQQSDDVFIFNKENENMKNWMQDKVLKPQQIPIDETSFNKNSIVFDDKQAIDMQLCSLKGTHNFFNASCAIQAAKLLGIDKDTIQKGINSFVNEPHRLELVATINGVDYINDSKATNVDAVYYALQAMDKPVVWIAGGTDKGNDYADIESFVKEKVHTIICMGVDNQKLLEYFTPIVKNIEETSSAAEAVQRASIYAEEGDVILLSPACASFDLFKNYIDRGNQFKEEVQKLKIQ